VLFVNGASRMLLLAYWLTICAQYVQRSNGCTPSPPPAPM